MNISHEKMDCICTQEKCPAHSRCCFLPTEVHPGTDGKVDILFIGQGGGKEERALKRPFIGKSGQRLRTLVLEARKNLSRHFGVAFSNTIRDNPPLNRPPNFDELNNCLRYLYNDIKILKEKGLRVVMPLGHATAKYLIRYDIDGITGVRGKVYTLKDDIFGEITAIPSFHPSYLIRMQPKYNTDPMNIFDKKVLDDIIYAYKYGLV